MESLRRQLEENKKEMEEMEQSWQQRLNQEANRSRNVDEDASKLLEMRKTHPHLWNLNEDPALTDMIIHVVRPGDCRVGKPPADIQLNGLR